MAETKDDHLTVTGMVTGLAELSTLLLSVDSVERVVWAAAGIAVTAIDEVTACGVSVARQDQLVSLMPELAVHAKLEDLQYTSASGPIIDAMSGGSTVLVTDMGTEGRWPEFPERALAAGVYACAVLPLRSGDDVLGALTLYAPQPCTFAGSARTAELIAELTSTALCCMMENTRQVSLSGQLREALDSRAVIDQAKGMLMLQQQCSADEAFATLRRTSQHRNVKLRDVAAQLVASISR